MDNYCDESTVYAEIRNSMIGYIAPTNQQSPRKTSDDQQKPTVAEVNRSMPNDVTNSNPDLTLVDNVVYGNTPPPVAVSDDTLNLSG